MNWTGNLFLHYNIRMDYSTESVILDGLDEMRNNIIYSGEVYAPEGVFSGWLGLSYTLLATSLLFYHMSQLKTISASSSVAAFVSICLVAISALYMIFAIGPYTGRMNHVIEICKHDRHCNKDKLQRLIIVKNSYITLGILTSLIQLIIVWLIYHKAMKQR